MSTLWENGEEMEVWAQCHNWTPVSNLLQVCADDLPICNECLAKCYDDVELQMQEKN